MGKPGVLWLTGQFKAILELMAIRHAHLNLFHGPQGPLTLGGGQALACGDRGSALVDILQGDLFQLIETEQPLGQLQQGRTLGRIQSERLGVVGHQQDLQVAEGQCRPVTAGRPPRPLEHLLAQLLGLIAVLRDAIDHLPDAALQVLKTGGRYFQVPEHFKEAVRTG